MGADIYLDSVYEKQRKELKVEELRDKVNELRNSTSPTKNALYDAAFKEYEEADAKARDGAYYRDSYNSSNLAWLFGLSYWQEGGENIDDEGHLKLERVQHWHDLMAGADMRQLVETAVANGKLNKERNAGFENMVKPQLQLGPDDTIDSAVDFFTKKRDRFVKLLAKAIELKEPIVWSV